jgi:DNA-binding MarR family transcriptional regulator
VTRTGRSYQVGAEFRSALRRFHRRTDEICRARGLTSEQYTLLLMVSGAPDGSGRSSIRDLAARLHVAHNGAVERVQRAEAAGLVVRERSETDRRVALVRLTPEGERRLAAAFADLGEESDRLVEYMAGVDREDRRRTR